MFSHFTLVSSVTNAVTTLISPNVTSELYNITVTCTIHPDSTADQCVVMAMADGRVTRTGNKIIAIILIYVRTYVHMYVRMIIHYMHVRTYMYVRMYV